jgi:ribosomal protein S18 acetylase RimI-like enzyme
MSYIYREIVENDLEKVAELFDAYRIFYEKKSDLEGAKIFLSERFRNNESKIFICENQKAEIVGFVQLYPIFSSTRMKRLWLLNDLFVNENFRGLGISVSLIGKAQELCRETNACGLILETAKSNKIGNSLYLKTGFSLDTEHNYYSWEEN